MSDLAAIEETMTEVKRNWNVMLQDQFNPIMVALEMLQNSNPSHDYESFLRLHGQLEEAMATIVEKYYTGFNNAVSIFGGIVDNTNLAKDIVCKVKEGAGEFRDQVHFKRVEIPDLWSKVQQYKGTFAVSDKLEQVQRQQVAAMELAKRRFFIPAARTLMGAIYDSKYLSNANLVNTAELVKLLEDNRDGMFDTIVDEIHALIYFKEEGKEAQQLFARLLEKIPEAKALPVGFMRQASNLSIDVAEVDLVLAPAEFNFDPRSNAVAYLSSLVRAAAILELVPSLLSILSQRIVSEVYQITERCISKAERDFQKGVNSGEGPLFVPVLRGTMDKGEGKEFDLFVPILRKLLGNIFGRLLTVANCIKIIGDATGTIVQESGVPLDVYAFYRNCLSALHGEVKNFLAALFHGPQSANTRLFTSPIVAITEALKGKRLRSGSNAAKTPLYQFVNVIEEQETGAQGGENSLKGIMDVMTILSAKEVESARKLASMLAVDPFASSAHEMGHQLIVKPNLQYLAIVYREFVQFDDWLRLIFTVGGMANNDRVAGEAGDRANKELASSRALSPSSAATSSPASAVAGAASPGMVAKRSALDASQLRFVDATFVEHVLAEEYIPAIENYILQELARSFNGADALLWQEIVEVDMTLPVGRHACCLLNCVSAFVGLLSQVACVLHQIPGSQAECEQLMTTLMAQFLERIDAKFRELVTSRATDDASGATAFIAISSQFVMNGELRALLAKHSMLTKDESAGEAGHEDLDAIVAEKEILLLEGLKSDRSLHRNEIIFDSRIIRSIALLQRSLELLPQVLADANFGVVSFFPKYRPEFLRESHGVYCKYFDGSSRGLITFTNNFEVQFINFLDALKRLSQTCLFMLRTELRVHCFYYLDLTYREGNYDFEEVCTEPDTYISSLATDLIRFESLMSDWLPYSRYHLVMDELHQALTEMLISDFRYVRSLNAFGCRKLELNVATLEQILALISSTVVGAADLHRARTFYQLAAAGPDGFLEMAPRLPCRYTAQQYQSIFDVYYRDAAGESGLGLQKTYQNQLIRLKYLLENLSIK